MTQEDKHMLCMQLLWLRFWFDAQHHLGLLGTARVTPKQNQE